MSEIQPALDSAYSVGDILHVWVDDTLPEPNHELPDGDGWEAIVVDLDPQRGCYEIAWRTRFTTPLKNQGPVRETWDDSTAIIEPGMDCHAKLLQRATYEKVEVGG